MSIKERIAARIFGAPAARTGRCPLTAPARGPDGNSLTFPTIAPFAFPPGSFRHTIGMPHSVAHLAIPFPIVAVSAGHEICGRFGVRAGPAADGGDHRVSQMAQRLFRRIAANGRIKSIIAHGGELFQAQPATGKSRESAGSKQRPMRDLPVDRPGRAKRAVSAVIDRIASK